MTAAADRVAARVDVSWTWKRFDALSADDVYDLLELRSAVFVVEQRCSFLDPDRRDRSAWHLLGRVAAERGDPAVAVAAALAAYLRCLDPGVKHPEPSIGRVVTAPAFRGAGLGRALMDEGLVRSHDAWPAADLVIDAQLRLEPFYRSLGFRTEGVPYVEDDIDHVRMRQAAQHDASPRRADPSNDIGNGRRR